MMATSHANYGPHRLTSWLERSLFVTMLLACALALSNTPIYLSMLLVAVDLMPCWTLCESPHDRHLHLG